LRTIADRNNDAKLNEQLHGLAEDLINLSGCLSKELEGACPQETLRVRTHQLAIAKILVFTYGKSDFRLASAHYHQGRAYLLCKAYEQAVNHLTIASTKISKINEIKETKLYNSYILTTLGICYYEIERYDYSLEVLTRAYDIQNSSQIQKNNFIAKLTIEMLTKTYLKLHPS
jgi:tetratricopeptide (TPR) repeat protein